MHRTYQCVLAHIRACLGAATPAGIPVQSAGGETPVILHPFVAPVPVWIQCGAKKYAWLFGPYPLIHGGGNKRLWPRVSPSHRVLSRVRRRLLSDSQGKPWRLGFELYPSPTRAPPHLCSLRSQAICSFRLPRRAPLWSLGFERRLSLLRPQSTSSTLVELLPAPSTSPISLPVRGLLATGWTLPPPLLIRFF